MRKASAFLVVVLCLAAPARAALSRHHLADAGFHLLAATPMPATAIVHGPTGDLTLGEALASKPALVVFTDYRCQSLCGVVLDQLAETLPRVPLAMGRDYNVIAVALASDQTQADAQAFRDTHTKGTSLAEHGLFLTNDEPALERLRESVGLVAPFDAEHQQFAHPAGLVLVDAAGRAQRILSPYALDPFDLKLALTETGAAPRSLATHALLLCYGFNPASGIYTLRITRVLSMAAAVTIVMIGVMVALFLYRERRLRHAASIPGPNRA